MKWKRLIPVLIIVLAFVFRLSIINTATHGDIVIQSGWGHWIYENRSMYGFYENKNWIYGWPNQPPLISFLYGFSFNIHEWFNTTMVNFGSFIALNHLGASHIPWFYRFITWFTQKFYSNTPYLYGQLISLKLISIIADLGLAVLIYFFVKKKSNTKKATFFLLTYLIMPFSWYESAIWAQHDQLAFIFLLSTFLCLMNKKWNFFAPLMFLISIGLKVTGLIFMPLFIWLAIGDKKNFIKIFLGSVVAILMYFILVKLISPNNFIVFNLNLQKQIFAKGDLATWVNAFNFWHLTTGFLTDSRNIFLGLSYKVWGYLTFGIFYIYSFYISQKRDFWSSMKAMFNVGFSGWLFMTTMHERYLFAAIILGLILSVKYKKIFKYWLVLSLIFGLNLYYAWWQPEFFNFLKNILEWQGNLISKLLSLMMIGIFIKILKIIK